jgi:hypothetical protein
MKLIGMFDTLPSAGVLAGAPLNQANIASAVALRFARHVHPERFPADHYPCLEQLSARCEAMAAFAATPLE